jgi:hypothetical protein
MTNIKWQPVIGFERYYLVSDSGKVWSLYRHRTLTPAIDKYGYEKVALFKNGKAHSRTVHRLVAQAFLPNPHNLPTVNHINEIKTDNRVTNLEWVSIADNDNHGTRNQRMADTKCKQPVEQILKDGRTILYKGVKDAWRKTGINRGCIAKCCKGFRKTAGGYKWRYANEIN